jgi:predicted DNA-binding transcriptional regulator AlpA
MDTDYLSPDQVCELLPGISKSTLSQWRYLGMGPRYRKLGKTVVYVRSEVIDWVEASARTSTAEALAG